MSDSTLIGLNENTGQGVSSNWSPEEKAYFLDFISAKKGEHVLDLGCGNGVFSQWLNEIGCQVHGLDFSFKALKQARGFQSVSVQGDVAHLPFQSEIFDRVVFIEVLEHVPPNVEQAVLAEIRRVLKPDGELVLHTSPNRIAEVGCLLLNPLVFICRILGLTRRGYFVLDDSTKDFHINKHTPRSLSRAVRAAGYLGEVRPYTSFCTFPWRLVKACPWLDAPWLTWCFGLRFRGKLRNPQASVGGVS